MYVYSLGGAKPKILQVIFVNGGAKLKDMYGSTAPYVPVTPLHLQSVLSFYFVTNSVHFSGRLRLA